MDRTPELGPLVPDGGQEQGPGQPQKKRTRIASQEDPGRSGQGALERQSALNLKTRQIRAFGEPKRVKLETRFRAKRFTARFEPNGFGEPKRDLIRVLGRQGALNSKPRFGPKGFGEPKRVKLLTPDSVQRLL